MKGSGTLMTSMKVGDEYELMRPTEDACVACDLQHTRQTGRQLLPNQNFCPH